MDKKTTRRNLRIKRKQIGAKQRQEKSIIIAKKINSILAFKNNKTIACFMPTQEEPNILLLGKIKTPSLYTSKKIAIPRVDRFIKGLMGFYLLSKKPKQTTKRIAPFLIRAFCVPLVGFDKNCNRLGMGGGYYDRLFERLDRANSKAVKIGVAFACQQVEQIPLEPWDKKLDYIVTEKQTFKNI